MYLADTEGCRGAEGRLFVPTRNDHNGRNGLRDRLGHIPIAAVCKTEARGETDGFAGCAFASLAKGENLDTLRAQTGGHTDHLSPRPPSCVGSVLARQPPA